MGEDWPVPVPSLPVEKLSWPLHTAGAGRLGRLAPPLLLLLLLLLLLPCRPAARPAAPAVPAALAAPAALHSNDPSGSNGGGWTPQQALVDEKLAQGNCSWSLPVRYSFGREPEIRVRNTSI